jgi:NAD(P)-dependent dehydrogenase (short-subunit alcohol dehydrogenase family)
MRTALVTGASTGIGEACAQRLVGNGWRVFAGVRRAGDGPAGTEEIILDVTDAGQVAAAAQAIPELHGLVNNAGIALAAPLEYIPVDELRRQLDVNVIAQVAVTQAFLPKLRATRGRIVFMGSIAGRSALPFLGAYAASKHALEAISDSFRVELEPFGIGVTIVEPGTILTPIWTKSAAVADAMAERMPPEMAKLYGDRIAVFRRLAAKRGAGGASADSVARVVEEALTADRPPTRKLVGRDARLRAGLQRLPDRARDRLIRRALLGD